MLETRITKDFNLSTPIINAGMAMVARPRLAAAVSNAGGLGTIGCDINPPAILQNHIQEVKALTDKAFGVDLIGDFLTDDHMDILVEEGVPLVIFFWSPPTLSQVKRLQENGSRVWMQVGAVSEAQEAIRLGMDGLIIQGAEAGGHNRSEASTMTLFPRIRSLFPDIRLIAAGGIVNGATMAAALALGADAVWCGSRFLAACESAAHDDYKSAVVNADVGDTLVTSIYGPEWPGQKMRVIVNNGAKTSIGREDDAIREAAGAVIGTTNLNGEKIPVPRYSAILPTSDFEGDIEQTCLTAGQSIGNIFSVLSAADIIQQMTTEAIATINALSSGILSRTPAPAI
ncbi:nitronate monooxygenase [Sneathiella chungangensis]|uniref:Nitronate monooxygenase n=1 Tax=Sneathiella chungangensis TaxID=1418234 RepID=A0A845MFC8_9PROT|nr:nitronate monooxygenase [Sneathiella chungangensis]MZR22753.1 nitronate monooxygenase [Sneathiella chungangensis]